MDKKLYQKIMSGRAVLFCGAGFSYGAKNILNENIPNGIDLAKVIADECAISGNAELSRLSFYFQKIFGADGLINLLKNQLTVSTVKDWHETISKLPWKRIYTTNYDAVIETAGKASKSLTPICYSDDFRASSKENVCIHINGYIERLNRKTLDTEFRLTNRSYFSESLKTSPWYEMMRSDFETAELIVVIGYSMQVDLDIMYLFSLPRIKEKVVIIDSPASDELSKKILPDYGEYLPIGIQGFAQEIKECESKFKCPISKKVVFCSFEHIYKKPVETAKVEFPDLVKFYSIGTFRSHLLQRDTPSNYFNGYKYILYRDKIDGIFNNLNRYKYFIVTSDLGNGKSIFCELLINEAQFRNIHIFKFVKKYTDWEDEVQMISTRYKNNTIVIFDDYNSYMEILKRFAYYDTHQITFVLTARTALNNAKYRSLREQLQIDNENVKTININHLSNNEIENLAYILQKNGLLGTIPVKNNLEDIIGYLQKECKARFCDLLLAIYNSSDIKKRIEDLILDLHKENQDVQDVVLFILMKTVMNLSIDLYDFESMLSINHTNFQFCDSQAVNELFELKTTEPTVKSSIVAKSILKDIVPLNDLLMLSKKLLLSSLVAYNIQSNLLSYTHYAEYAKDEQKLRLIYKFYDDLRLVYSDNHFFWEQFALVNINCKDYEAAMECINNAYRISRSIPNFVPFQIETIHASCILSELQEKHDQVDVNSAMEKVRQSVNLIFNNIDHPDNDILRAFRIIKNVKFITEFYLGKFDTRAKSIFMEVRAEIIKQLNKFSASKDLPYIDQLVNWKEEFISLNNL